MKRPVLLLLAVAGCRAAPGMAWPLGVSYEARAACPDVSAALLTLKERHAIGQFYRWSRTQCVLDRPLLLPEIVPISTRDEISSLLAPSEHSFHTASANLGNLTLEFSGGNVEARQKEGDASAFARETGGLLASMGAGAPEWLIQTYMEWDDLRQVLSFFRTNGVREVRVGRWVAGSRFVESARPLDDFTRGERPASFSAAVGEVQLTCQPRYGGGVAFWITCSNPAEFTRMAGLWQGHFR